MSGCKLGYEKLCKDNFSVDWNRKCEYSPNEDKICPFSNQLPLNNFENGKRGYTSELSHYRGGW